MASAITNLNAAALLTALRTPSPDADGRIPLPERILITPWGISHALDGSPVIVDDDTLTALATNQTKLGRAEIALDFEHNTVPSTSPSSDPHKVAAYGTLSVEKGLGIYFHPTHWTPEGKDHYTGGHYRDISPTVIRDTSGRVIALHSAALTRAGQIEGLHAFSASPALLTALSALTPNNIEMTNHTPLLIKILGLEEEATDEDIIAAATKYLDKEKKPVPTEPEVTPMSAEARMDAFERRQLISEATAAGKIIPFSSPTLETLSLSALKDCLANLKPGSVPTSARTTDTTNQDRVTPKALSAEEAQVAQLLGIDPKQYAKQLASSNL